MAIWNLPKREGGNKKGHREKNPITCRTASSPHCKQWLPALKSVSQRSSSLIANTPDTVSLVGHQLYSASGQGQHWGWATSSNWVALMWRTDSFLGRKGWRNQVVCLGSSLDCRTVVLAYKWSHGSQVQECELGRWSQAAKWYTLCKHTSFWIARFIATHYLLTEPLPSTGLLAQGQSWQIEGLWWLPLSNP